jgi:hypothetical protein
VSRSGRQARPEATLADDSRRPEDLGRRGRHAVGQLNFVFDPAQSLHATADQLSEWLGVKKTTMASKARFIRDTVKLSHCDAQLMRRGLVDASPLTWLLEVDGMLVDIRRAPVHLQVQAFELGLIPYVRGAADDRP